MSFARFMSGPVGRGIRVVVGLVLIIIGLSMGGAGGWILAIIGLVPLATGALNVCLFAPLFGGPFAGKDALDGS